MSVYNFFVCEPKFKVHQLTNIFSPNVGRAMLFRFRFVDHAVPEIFEIKVESCQNPTEFWTSQILLGVGLQKLYPRYYACLAARRVVEVS